MPKETFYFSHDYSARNDPKLQKLLMKMGHEGKGIFWDIIEILYEQNGYIMLSECEGIAFALRTNIDCINSLIKDFDLFDFDDEKFWSNSVLSRLNSRNEKSKKASDSAQKRWSNANASKINANASKNDAIKKSKVKESKVNIFIAPTIEEVKLYFKSKGINEEQAIRAFNHYDAFEWHDRNGNPVKSWKQKMITNWMKEKDKIENPIREQVVYMTDEERDAYILPPLLRNVK